ncbi:MULTISPECIES: hypothetical protein [unclassified Lysobacter]|uniref:hypothetical protein n=1 Tax=unclassified Lysobacter TaxID=2635362 RepID=UPI001BEA7DF5|nr:MULTISPECIES: hypothetical protein [unclassified Lysobacter]MBT2750026.1 hypothetical protein [Lysobacter sp. ISL-50]MBT2775402.1 hypothetical protein [Lysobacter sp. ISL-54]MBT2783525.1 hypothetical protein [Lysobacter sp. ISL-52]
MVSTNAVHFDAVCRGSLNWRVSINGEDDHVPFAGRDACIGAATARARRHHLDHSVTTEVWVVGVHGRRECIMRFMTPSDLEALLQDPQPSWELREACDQYGMYFPCVWPG